MLGSSLKRVAKVYKRETQTVKKEKEQEHGDSCLKYIVPSMQSLSIGDAFEGINGDLTVLRDTPSDLSSAQAIEHVLQLRKHQEHGSDIEWGDLYAIGKTTSGNRTQLFLDRAYFTDGLIPSIASAQTSIHIAMLSLDGGELGTYLVDLLIHKKLQNTGIEIRVIADDFGSSAIFPWCEGKRNLNRLRDVGIDVEINKFPLECLEHRKVVVVDGLKAFVGGACFTDEYFGNEEFWKAYEEVREKPDFNPDSVFFPQASDSECQAFSITEAEFLPEFHDFGVLFEGSSVIQIQAAFIQSWLQHGKHLNRDLGDGAVTEKYFPDTTRECEESKIVKIIHGIPKGHSEYRQGVLEVLDQATDTLDITFSYILIPEFVEHLKMAAKRGVKIRILVPGKEGIDKKIAWFAFRHDYPELLETGNIRIFEFKTYTHCKFIVADRRLVFTSTGNPEYNSWEGGWDETALIDSSDFAHEVEKRVFDVDLSEKRSIEVQLEDVQNKSIWYRVIERISRIIIGLFQSPGRKQGPRLSLISMGWWRRRFSTDVS